MQLKVKVKDLENTNSYETVDKLIVLTDENTNTSKNLDKSDLLTDIVSPDATNGLNIQNGGLYNKDVSNIIGDLSDLTTPVKSNVVNAVNYIQNTINTDLNKIGDLSDLTTTDKTSLVGAVNELYNSISTNDDLSNLSANGENRLHALKGYTESGQVYSDTQLYNDVLEQYYSTFDPSKFTAVGTPTITDDGIASGFSTSDYLTISFSDTWDKNTNFQFHVIFTTPSAWGTTGGRFWSHGPNNTIGHTTAGKLSGSFLGHSINNTDLNALDLSTKYEAFYIKDSTGFYVKYRKLGETTWITSTPRAVTSDDTISLTTQQIGKEVGSGFSFLGSIDLKQFSITVDGVPVFSGNKTGTDLIITDNYTVVGSLTIADGIASGFSNNNYLSSGTYKQKLGEADTWEIEMECITPAAWGNYPTLFGGDISSYANRFYTPSFGFDTSSKLRLLLSSNGTSWNIANGSLGTDTYNTSTRVGVRLVFTGTQYLAYSRLAGEDWKLQITVDSTTKVYDSGESFLFGQFIQGNTAYYRGSIDLNSIRIIRNGVLEYSEQLSIPYTLSDTGSKIVNINDIGSLQMLNNKSGGALYYTIDETNSEAALPFGNVYGLINKRADGDWENLTGSNIELSTVTAINTYDIDLSSYITSNLYDYEAVFDIDAKRTDNNSNATNYIVSLLLGDGTAIANYSNTFYKAQSYGDQFSVLLPKNIRKIRLQISGYALSSHSLKLLAWRRKGGNY